MFKRFSGKRFASRQEEIDYYNDYAAFWQKHDPQLAELIRLWPHASELTRWRAWFYVWRFMVSERIKSWFARLSNIRNKN
jgi:hypothetical protein